MRVRIVCYEDVHAWILGKFALRLNEELIKLGIQSDIAKTADPNANINHHIIYIDYDELKGSEKDTLMITHIDDIRKLNQVKRQLMVAQVGICMSKPLMEHLIMGGVPAEKLCYINPAHDGIIPVKRFTVGITSKVQPDGCKRESMLVELSDHISPDFFDFKIMGAGWEPVIESLTKNGFKVIYYPAFDREEYIKLIPSLDYYLYLGQDEGSMGFIDALAAGVKTIVTPQGYHLDAPNGIVYPFNTTPELIEVFNSIAKQKLNLINSVSKWTWQDYAIKHLELWKYLLNSAQQVVSSYPDGVNSLRNKVDVNPSLNKSRYLFRLYLGAFSRVFYKIKKGFSDYETFKKKSQIFLRNIFK